MLAVIEYRKLIFAKFKLKQYILEKVRDESKDLLGISNYDVLVYVLI